MRWGDGVTELKPCPFCGSENVATALAHPNYMLVKLWNKYVFAGCKDCGATTSLFFANNRTGVSIFNKENEKVAVNRAIEAWNRRADDAGPVRHAKNVMEDYPSLFQCSACGWSCDDTYCGDSAYRYCPGCGAKMDEEIENE